MTTEEEKKAIEHIKSVFNDIDEYEYTLEVDFINEDTMKIEHKEINSNDIETLLNLIEKLQKENEELNKQYDQLTQYFVKNHVAKDKIREIIEKLENEEKALRKDFEKHRVQLFELYKKVVLIEGYKKLLEEE